MNITWNNIITIPNRWMAYYLRRRGWVCFYLEERNRICIAAHGKSEMDCWLALYQAGERKS